MRLAVATAGALHTGTTMPLRVLLLGPLLVSSTPVRRPAGAHAATGSARNGRAAARRCERGGGALSWQNKCLQLAVVRLLPNKERVKARAYFQRACANLVGSGFAASAAERSNFVSVEKNLQKRIQ